MQRCLAKDPNRRYQSALDLRNGLEEIAQEAAVRGVGRERWRWVMRGGAIAAVALVALGLAASGRRWWGASGRPIQSVAVLPLANLMGEKSRRYYVAAMHDALIAKLGQISALTVISRTSVMRYRHTNKTAPEIARELNVDALVEGSMFRAGDNVRVQVSLFRATPAERQLWSQTNDGKLEEVMALQKSVARAIAEHMQVTVDASRGGTPRRDAHRPSSGLTMRGRRGGSNSTGGRKRRCKTVSSMQQQRWPSIPATHRV